MTTHERLMAALADRYRIERELGAGGKSARIDVTQSVGGDAARIVVMQNWLANLRRTPPRP